LFFEGVSRNNPDTFYRGEIPSRLERLESRYSMINTNTEDTKPEFDMEEMFEQARPTLPRQLDDEDIRIFIGEREQCL